MIVLLICVAIGSYLIGSINCSILISKIFNKDVRQVGSGNAGATNMVRAFGPVVGVATMLGDFLKTLVALLLTKWLFADVEYWQAAIVEFIETYNGQNTKSMRLDGKSRRVVVMDKFKAQVTIDGVCENLA